MDKVKDSLSDPAVLVTVVNTGGGKQRIEITELNGFESLAVPTLLRIAAKMKEQSFSI